ncbi:HAD family acid phosphatase [Angustibacter aerolatus]
MSRPTWSRRLTRRSVAVGAGLLSLGLVGGGVAVGATQQPAIHTSTPRTERDVTNIDVLRQQLRNYYGDPLGTGVVGPRSNYVREATKVAAKGTAYLAARSHGRHTAKQRAIVLDVDDTSLVTWNYEIASNWAYEPVSNAKYVDGQLFPAVPGMQQLSRYAAKRGYAVVYLTGRPSTQEAATLGNLTADGVGVDAGFAAPTALKGGEDGLFTKPAVADYPDYLQAACAGDPGGKCTTIHYKSATRKHLESLGYDVVANFGDQYSDLKGGYADRTFKLPNPNYFLP